MSQLKNSVTYARKFTDDVEWSCEDGTRTDIWIICARQLNLQLTVGLKQSIFQIQLVIRVPSEFTKIITTIKK